MLIYFEDIYVNRLPVTIAKNVADRARKLENLSGQNSTKNLVLLTTSKACSMEN